MGYFIKPDNSKFEFDFKRGFMPTETLSTIQFTSKSLDKLLSEILKESRLSEKRKNEFRTKYRIMGIGKDIKIAKGDFYLKLYEKFRELKNRKKKTKTEEEILELYSKYISKKEALSISS